MHMYLGYLISSRFKNLSAHDTLLKQQQQQQQQAFLQKKNIMGKKFTPIPGCNRFKSSNWCPNILH